MSQTGKLYGVGVGPGDPGLLTLRAAAVIRDCPVLAVPVSGGERQLALEIARREGAELSVLQPRSPICGPRQVYDGTFSGRRVDGRGVFAALLLENGFRVLEPGELP